MQHHQLSCVQSTLRPQLLTSSTDTSHATSGLADRCQGRFELREPCVSLLFAREEIVVSLSWLHPAYTSCNVFNRQR